MLCQLPEEKLLNIETLCKELHIQTPVQGNLSRYDEQMAAGRDIRRWVPGGLSSWREVRWCIYSRSDQHGHQQSDGGGQLDKADHYAETLLQAAMSPVADWDFTRDQLSALLLLFCCYCEQTKFLVATVSRHYFHLQLCANYIVSLKFLFHFENISYFW